MFHIYLIFFFQCDDIWLDDFTVLMYKMYDTQLKGLFSWPCVLCTCNKYKSVSPIVGWFPPNLMQIKISTWAPCTTSAFGNWFGTSCFHPALTIRHLLVVISYPLPKFYITGNFISGSLDIKDTSIDCPGLCWWSWCWWRRHCWNVDGW